jgi:surface carbohydrate biosynthesis protein
MGNRSDKSEKRDTIAMTDAHAAVGPVVILVDNKKRDLNAASLIALHLRRRGVECVLEPLEAFRAVIPTYRPSMVIINHVAGSHIVAWSKWLREIGVLVGLLSNEGMFLHPDVLRYGSGWYYENAHLDHVFCWNERHRQALIDEGAYKNCEFHVVGVPRFDFYFEPFSRSLYQSPATKSDRKHILACTNFGMARFQELPRQAGDKFFAAWSKQLKGYENYWEIIATQWRSRQQFIEHMNALIKAGKYDITVRPHPVEDREFYDNWFTSLLAEQKTHIKIDAESNITALILGCDLEISGESCTTAVESWIAGKPTVELEFERHPMLYDEERSKGNVHCKAPAELSVIVESQLANPSQIQLSETRKTYLKKWCASPDGRACERMADLIAVAVKGKKPSNWSKLNANDFRRALKLQGFRTLGLAYHFDPFLPVKNTFFPKRYAVKNFVYQKSIKPHDVLQARHQLEEIFTPSKRSDIQVVK